jgi:exopolysaccharide production protein ExoQ
MSPASATVIVVIGILGLFWLDRDVKLRTSAALWIPVVWLAIACSRPVSSWFSTGSSGITVDQFVDRVMDGSPTDRLVFTCLLAAGIVVLLGRARQVGNILRANRLILFCFLYFAVSLIWSDYPDVAFKRWAKLVGDFVMVLIVLTDRQPLEAIQRLLARLAFVLIPLSILFIKYYPQLGTAYSQWTGGAIYTGVTTNKNTLGVICLCLGLGASWRILTIYGDRGVPGRFRRLIAQGVILAMMLYLFRLMDSMTSLASFLMALCLLLATRSRLAVERPAVIHLLVASMLAVSVSVAFLGVSPNTLRAMGRNPTLTDRTMLWGNLLGLVQNSWFGTGFESFWLGPRLGEMWRLSGFVVNEAHNGYLEVFLNLGWMGVALLATVIVTGYRKVFGAWRTNGLKADLSLTYFFVGLVYNFTEAAFFKIQAPAWIFFLLAITSVPVISSSTVRTKAQELPTTGPVGQEHEQPAFSEHQQYRDFQWL